MLSVNTLAKAVGTMSLMKMFPGGDEFRGALMELLGEMCETDEQVLWLARRMRDLYREWPGANEVRAVLCSKYSPKDGVEVFSDVFHDGIPSERMAAFPALPAANPRMIEGAVTEDWELNLELIELAKQKAMPEVPKRRTVAEIEEILYKKPIKRERESV